MKRNVIWKRLDTLGVEYAEMESNPLRVEGDVIVREGGPPWSVSYRMDCNEAMMTRNVSIRLKCDGVTYRSEIARNARGAWSANGVALPDLDGIDDVDLSITPSTNWAPIRRLQLRAGDVATVTAAWVCFPTLDVVPLRQVYRRIGDNAYEYEAPDIPFRATIQCDNDGIVETYGDLWRRA